MKKNLIALSTGFALFSMFFGSGNLVFPITVGKESGGHFILAALGIIATGVVVPFLGAIGMMLYKGDTFNFFRVFGKKGTLLFTFLALSLMGPFGVLARCLTVAHGALLLIIPGVPLQIASGAMCLVIFLLALNKHRIISLLGTLLTPFLLGSIAIIAYQGVSKGTPPSPSSVESFTALKTGFLQGYQTMDLLAAFFFSQFVIQHLYKHGDSEKNTLRTFCKAALIGGGLLSFVYFLLVLLGAEYASLLSAFPPEEMLGAIAMKTLGVIAAPLVCVAVIFACLTTAIVLASLFAEFLRKEMGGERFGHKSALIITLIIGFMISTLQFSGIAKFLGPLLEMVYPALIALTLANIGIKLFPRRQTE